MTAEPKSPRFHQNRNQGHPPPFMCYGKNRCIRILFLVEVGPARCKREAVMSLWLAE
jgi:hypothetical protein